MANGFWLALVPALLNFGILVYLILFLPKSKSTVLFSLLLISLILWQTEDVFARTLGTLASMQFCDSILSIGWLSVGPLIFHFVLTFTNSQSKVLKYSLLIYAPFLVFYALYVSFPNPVPFNYHSFWGWVSEPRKGTLDLFQRHSISLIIFLSLLILVKHTLSLKNTQIKRKRTQAILIVIGILIPTVQGTLTQVILPAYYHFEIPVTSSVMTILSICIILALGKYSLFHVEDSLNIESVLDNIDNIILIATPNGKVIYKNLFSRHLFGSSYLESTVRIEQLMSKGDYEKFEQAILKPTLKGLMISDYEIPMKGENNAEIDVLMSTELIVNNKVIQGILFIGHDVTEHKKQTEAIFAQNVKLKQIAWDQSHVVRAPLASILGLVQLLKYSPDQVEQEVLLSHLTTAAEKLDEVIHNIVSTSQPYN